MKFKIFKIISICAFLSLASTWCEPAGAEQKFKYSSDDWLDARYDWVIYLTPTRLEKYLSYPTSGIHPIDDVLVSYRVAPKFKTEILRQTRYESLWYHGAQAIGRRQYAPLKLDPGWQGAIVIPDTADAYANPGALANAIIRLLLDVNLKKCSLTVVFASPSLGQQICDQIGQFRFLRTDDDSVASPGTLRFFVSSADIRDRTFLVYKPQN